MIKSLNCLELGTNLVPFSPHIKCWPIAVAAGISALGGLANSVVNSGSQKSANETNLEAVRQTNETNRAIAAENNRISQAQFDANQKWLREQFYAQRAFERENMDYNSPSEYVARLRAAGINPAFAIGNMPTSMPGSSVGGVGASSSSQLATGYAEAGHVDPVHYDFSGITEPIGHAVNAYYQNQLINEQTKGMSINNEINRTTAAVQVSKQIQELRNLQEDYHVKLAQKGLSESQRDKLQAETDMIDKQIAVFTNQMDALSKQPKLNNDLLIEQKSNVKWSTELMKIEASLKPALAYSQIRLNQSQMNVLSQQVTLIANEAREAYARGEKVTAETIAQRLKNSMLNIESQHANQKWFVRQGTEVTKTVAAWSDYFGDLIFGSIARAFK